MHGGMQCFCDGMHAVLNSAAICACPKAHSFLFVLKGTGPI